VGSGLPILITTHTGVLKNRIRINYMRHCLKITWDNWPIARNVMTLSHKQISVTLAMVLRSFTVQSTTLSAEITINSCRVYNFLVTMIYFFLVIVTK